MGPAGPRCLASNHDRRYRRRPHPPTSHRRVSRQLLRDSGYVLLGLPLALASFVVLLVGLALGLGLVVTVIGLPILAGTLYAARGLADIERLRLPAVLGPGPDPAGLPAARARRGRLAADLRADPGRPVLARPGPRHPQADRGRRHLRGDRHLVGRRRWSARLYWAYDWALPARRRTTRTSTSSSAWATRPPPGSALYTAIGVFFLITLPMVVRGCALLQAGFARALLTGVAEMRNRITVLEEQKRAAVSAEADRAAPAGAGHPRRPAAAPGPARDGPRAGPASSSPPTRRRPAGPSTRRSPRPGRRSPSCAPCPGASRRRSWSTGGCPAPWRRWPGAALVPVELRVDPRAGHPGRRLDPAVESTAYFVVAEALTNVAKHSRATECRGRGDPARAAGWRSASTDDGQGGAHLAKGHGLAGIADRVRAAGGRLDVVSPAGGPTEIRAELPL